MDTNKENELMQNLERQTPTATFGNLADGRPVPNQQGKPGKWQAVNPANPNATNPGQASSQASHPSNDGPSAIEQVDAEMVNRIMAYGAEEVYDASRDV